MKIESAIKLSIAELREDKEPEHVFVTFDSDGRINGLRWLYNTSDDGLYSMVKRRKGVWDGSAKMWAFNDESAAKGMLDAIRKRNPSWLILSKSEDQPLALAGVHFCIIDQADGKSACLLPFPLPYYAKVEAHEEVICTKLIGKQKDVVTMLVGKKVQIQDFVSKLEKQGALADNTLAKRWQFAATSKIKVKLSGWAVQIVCDLSNPFHYLAIPEQQHKWEGAFPNGVKVAVPWHGIINTTRKLWPTWKTRIEAAGLEYEGDNPEADIVLPVKFKTAQIPGWNSPAKNGHTLHEYQKEGASFCAKRGMRALIGDEMGVGKTAQAIAAAEAVGARKVLVICPASARYVWDREINGWGSGGTVQHIANQLDKIDMEARWHIATYDQMVSRTETWRLQDEQEEKAFLAIFPERKKEVATGDYPKRVSLSQSSLQTPEFADVKRVAAWKKIMRRLQGELVEQIVSAGPILVIIDEAHRIKNGDAKRSKAIRGITCANQTLLLTGTPLRNNEHEAAVLLSYLDEEAEHALGKQKGYTIQDVKDYLGYFMIRRTKAEVLPELPEKTRQRIDIDGLDADALADYYKALDYANKSYHDALGNGASEAQARNAMQGGVALARTALGLSKIRSSKVADLVADVVENKECCVVFCAHHQVSDELTAQLHKMGLKSAVVDGRTSQIERGRIEIEFQKGDLQVFIGGINAAGEAITLTRADTVVFVELDWVPAALMQAEDRIHRIGQKSNCQVIQLIAKLDEPNLDEEMISIIGSKLERIGQVLEENTNNIIEAEGAIRMEVFNRLLGKQPGSIQQAALEPIPSPTPIRKDSDVLDVVVDVAATEDLKPAAEPTNRQRGRPKIYLDQPPPSSTERSKRSVQSLKAAGGKRLMLRLTPEGLDALRTIMALSGLTQETEAINQALVERKQDLLRISTTK